MANTALTRLTQVALFVIEYALAQLLIQWGLPPQALLGEGVGEFVTACLSGVLSLEDALKIVTHQSDSLEARHAITQRFQLSTPQIPLLSGETGTWMTNEQATNPLYWARSCNYSSHISNSISVFYRRLNMSYLRSAPGNCSLHVFVSIAPILSNTWLSLHQL